ncbi:MAG: TolB family protein [Actinomycetota bacterium]
MTHDPFSIPHFSFSIARPWLHLGLTIVLLGLVASCGPGNLSVRPFALNSRYNDEQPALSGNGRYLAFVSNRGSQRNILLYDLQQQGFVELPRFNRRDAIAESPSLSNNARYIVYIASNSGRPELELYDRLTSSTQILTLGYRGWFRHPSISPDGRYIAFESSRRGQWDIEVIDRGPFIELDLLDGQPIATPTPSPQ